MVGTAAAALAVPIVDPIPAKSVATAASASGIVTTNDIWHLVNTLWPRRGAATDRLVTPQNRRIQRIAITEAATPIWEARPGLHFGGRRLDWGQPPLAATE
ncbi:Uncharacterised protein [Mycobacterium tuberculosis]|nr:Uncharacterised protein [Mycobacterium tuberculosis]